MDFTDEKFANRTLEQQADHEKEIATQMNQPQTRLIAFNEHINGALAYAHNRLRVDFDNRELKLMFWYQLNNDESVKAFAKRVENGTDFIEFKDWMALKDHTTQLMDKINEQPIPVGGIPYTAIDYLITDAAFNDALNQHYNAWASTRYSEEDRYDAGRDDTNDYYNYLVESVGQEFADDVRKITSAGDVFSDVTFADTTDPEYSQLSMLQERDDLMLALIDQYGQIANLEKQAANKPKTRVYNVMSEMMKLQVSLRQQDRDLGFFSSLHDGAFVVQTMTQLNTKLNGQLFCFEIPSWNGGLLNSWAFVASGWGGWIAAVAVQDAENTLRFVPAILSPNWADAQNQTYHSDGVLINFETAFSEVVLARLPVNLMVELMSDVDFADRKRKDTPDFDWHNEAVVHIWQELSSDLETAISLVVGHDNQQVTVVEPEANDIRFYEVQ